MTKRKASVPVFKPYTMDQMTLMPSSYDELIPADHLVRVVNQAVEQIKLDNLVRSMLGRYFELSSTDDAEGAGVCVLQADLHIAQDRIGTIQTAFWTAPYSR